MLAVFLRFPGCNLACSYCDTAWVNEPQCPIEELDLEEIVSYLQATKVKNVTITGGEPLLQPEMDKLLGALSLNTGLHVEVETNGSIALEAFQKIAPNVSFTMDYKLPDSGMEAKMHHPNLALLRETDTLKLVCGSGEDLQRAKELLEKGEIPEDVPVYLSPVFGKLAGNEIVDFMKQNDLGQVRLQLQLHKFLWPPEMRGV
jgi:7-carboxy-7-deazaguanine synthase